MSATDHLDAPAGSGPRLGFDKWLWVILAIVAIVAWARPRSTALIEGGPAPDLAAGQWFNAASPVSLGSLSGKVVVVEFWATWCPPCRDSIPHLNKLHKKWADQDVVVIGLTDESPETVKRFMNTNPMLYVVGAGSRSGDDYGVRAIPDAVIIDRQGNLVWQGYPDRALDDALAAVVDGA